MPKPPPKKPRGRALRWGRAEIAQLAQITPADVALTEGRWERYAPRPALLAAKAQEGTADANAQ